MNIRLRGVRVHNLKNVDLDLPTGRLIAFSGVSGSGKSSLAFDTIFSEGQTRYIESLSVAARRVLQSMKRPDADLIEGLSPTIAIEQKTIGNNPRSTVGTVTGIYDILRVLYARIATPYCPISQNPLTPMSIQSMVEDALSRFHEKPVYLLAPYLQGKKGDMKEALGELSRKGFLRVRLDGIIHEISEIPSVNPEETHSIEIVVDRLKVVPDEIDRLREGITEALELGGMMMIILPFQGDEKLYSLTGYSKQANISYPPLEPHDFSFNHPLGMCPTCEGLGYAYEFDFDKIIDPEKSISQDCCSIASPYETVKYGNIYRGLAEEYDFDVSTPWKFLSEKAKEVFLFGIKKRYLKMTFSHPKTGKEWTEYVAWKGVIAEAKKRLAEAKSQSYHERMRELMREGICQECNGSRIKPYPAAARFFGKTLQQLTALSLPHLIEFFSKITLSEKERQIGGELVYEVVRRLEFLDSVGLDYLTLERSAPTLSGGEAQRVRLASQIGSGLIGATYILDEPSIGLHPQDNTKLIHTLQRLKALGNTVIVVEHDEETLRSADWIVDVGPLAGSKGGKIICSGTFKDLLEQKHSITGAYLRKDQVIRRKIQKKKADLSHAITLHGARHHNLKNITVTIPLQMIVGVVGVSGSGKSTLINEILFPALSNRFHRSDLRVGSYDRIDVQGIDKVVMIDQSPIGRTPRSNPATYTKLFDDIRDLFAQLPESQAKGFSKGRFSFNVGEGSCKECGGMGAIKIDMDFLEDAFEQCPACEGKRFDEPTLSILYKGKSIHDVLEMTIEEACLFFESIPYIRQKLDLLCNVGLEYCKLGQSSTTLSGGEAQRIKLAKELSRPQTGKTLYILDEPTTGLHFHDIAKLLSILESLLEKGNSIILIEHNIDMIQSCDYLIELGPKGGDEGGFVIASGPIETLIKKKTPTGKALLAAKNLQPITAPSTISEQHHIEIRRCSQNTLKDISCKIPRGKITACTGPSGSGKSSFAFDTIYAEGMRRYADCLSPYARQFISPPHKPKVEFIEGLSPAISIEQKKQAGNPRSTVGTMTEIYDYLRLIYTHMSTPHCPETGEALVTLSKEDVCNLLLEHTEGTKLIILSPIKGNLLEQRDLLLQKGFLRVFLNKEVYDLDGEFPYDPKQKQEAFIVIDRISIKEGIQSRLYSAVEQALSLTKEVLYVWANGSITPYFLYFAHPKTGKTYPPIIPQTFSFNHEEGMCLTCLGLGIEYGVHLRKLEEYMQMNPIELMNSIWKEQGTEQAYTLLLRVLQELDLDDSIALSEQEEEKVKAFLSGGLVFSYKNYNYTWRGVESVFALLATHGKKDFKELLSPLLHSSFCPSCKGKRLNPYALAATINGYSISDLCALSLRDLQDLMRTLAHKPFLDEAFHQVLSRLHFLIEIGLFYLSLDRSAPTISSGEAQRIHLARQLGSKLHGCLYVLDEPTIGLHPYNNEKLNAALIELKNLSNTILLVEHDPMTIKIADYILDFGPRAGKAGGKIVARGSVEEIMEDPNSITGPYLATTQLIAPPHKPRAIKRWLYGKQITLHNLKDVSFQLPLSCWTTVTGVSGSGKSTLIHDVLLPALEMHVARKIESDIFVSEHGTFSGLLPITKVISLSQNPVGHTNRSDVCTYIEALTVLRTLFSQLPEAQIRGLKPMHFSYNHLKGMCKQCFGLGYKKISLQFLPPVRVECEACHGNRLTPLSLQVTYKGKHIGHILKMSVDEAKEFLPSHPKLIKLLETLQKVGLGYLQLGQEIASLSFGEAQRLRLAKELSKRSHGHCIYLFDEPTTGLHPVDIAILIPIFHALVDKGHTLIVIEHQKEMILQADYVIDIGPGAGIEGGEIVAQTTPDQLRSCKKSITGRYL